MKKIFILALLGLGIIISSYSFKSTFSDPNPPTSNTGAPTQSRTCVRCHGDFTLNTPGGSVIATGLPVGSYVPGQVYNFSVTITNSTAMQMWGFAMKAVISGTSGTALGTFSTTNSNTNVSAGEIRNSNGATFTGNSYTYNNLRWTAPASGSSPVSFYVTGIAADADGSEAGDYVYSNVYLNIVLPVLLGEIKGKLSNDEAIIEWNTYSESGAVNFELERSINGRNFEVIKTISSEGNSAALKSYVGIDNAYPKNQPILYYRLRMVDQNGKFEYSKVIILKPSAYTYVEKVYPTIIQRNDQVKVSMVSNTIQAAEIIIFSTGGQKIFRQVQMLQKGENNFTISGFIVPVAGLYIFKIKTGSFIDTRKIMVR